MSFQALPSFIPRPYKPAVFALSTQGLDNRQSNFSRSFLTSILDYEYWAANFERWWWDQWLTSPARTMPIDGHSYLTKRGWAGKGSGLRAGSVARPIVASQKRDSRGLGKDRDDHFEFWDQYVIPFSSFSITGHLRRVSSLRSTWQCLNLGRLK